MWKQVAKYIGRQKVRRFSTSRQHNLRVCVCGAAGGVGQPLSLILKTNPLVTEVKLYDINLAPGLGVDLSHINTFAPVKGYCGPENLKCALNCSDVVVLAAGKARKAGMTRADLFKSNATIISDIVKVIAEICPKALIALVTNPVNSLVPVIAEVMKKANVYDPKRVFGVTTLDVVRSRTFIADHLALDPQKVQIDVIGGHSDITILPVFSTAEPHLPIKNMDDVEVEKLTIRIQDAGKKVLEAKGGEATATLSMSYACGVFVNTLLMGLKGFQNAPVECSYIESNVIPELEYFATPLRFGKDGIKENLGVPRLNKYEQNLLKCLIPELKKDIEIGKEFAKSLK